MTRYDTDVLVVGAGLAGLAVTTMPAGRLRGLAGLRHRLVQVYDAIDDARVHAAMSTGLPDLAAFAAAIAALATAGD